MAIDLEKLKKQAAYSRKSGYLETAALIDSLVTEIERLRAQLATNLTACERCGRGVPPQHTVCCLCPECAQMELAELRRAAKGAVREAKESTMKAFLICPVRGHDSGETFETVCELEHDGWQVHWPFRDTDQTDPIGLEICRRNREAIADADMVFIVWDGKSTGSLFDLGMAFALGKPLGVIEAPAPTEGKSFQNMMREWERTCG